ncbi:MAG TPA: S8 family serine peptidase [Nitrosopumilaceae archaeon]|nr:S8 family serine peptidase [Nitrosopumilaceae archaeon]
MTKKGFFVIQELTIFLIFTLLFSTAAKPASAFYDADLISTNPSVAFVEKSGIITFLPESYENPVKRYVVFGSGPISDVRSIAHNLIYDTSSNNGFFSVGVFSQNDILNLKLKGYTVIEDFPLEFDSLNQFNTNVIVQEGSRIGKILGTEDVYQKYGYTGKGITIGIVDTGTDFSNSDVRDSVARDKNNAPVMIDADGQGLVLTNATFIANINDKGIIKNYTTTIPKNITSNIYVNSKGVFLNLNKNGNGTDIQVFNSMYPKGGSGPVLTGTTSSDYKIGKNSKSFIISKSGIYHFGVIYENVLQGQSSRLQLVPVLVVDSKIAGLYDTIIPDMSDSWKDFTRFDLSLGSAPQYDYDFTDETPITLGNGKEFLVYDSNNDGKLDYSAGTVGARVLDVYGVIGKSSIIDKKIGATNGTLLTPIDTKGNYFGVMYDFQGHGTSTAASIASKGIEKYDIYGNTTKYSLRGVAPGAKIVPIKALWFGDAVYGWLWAAGFNQEKNAWVFDGKPRVDILSNSWGISTFPILQSVPGLDIQSLLLSALEVPGSLDKNYPGILVVSSAGNAGHGYGTLGTPDAAPYALTIGAVTNNVYIGSSSFKNQPRFGNSTYFSGEIAGFSSRGPSLVGDPKPDLMGIGEYSFTPTSVTKYNKNATDPFVLFGGTSLAAPLVAGSAAVLMESLKQKGEQYDTFKIENILMSTATDLKNDPFTQGSGLVNVTNAVNFVKGKDDMFIVYNNASYSNIKKIVDVPIKALNSSSMGLERFQLNNNSFPQTSWFGGRLLPGDRTSATFTIENPTNKTLEIKITPQVLELIKKSQYDDTTTVNLQDSLLNKPGVYRPNYIPLENVKDHFDLLSFFKKSRPIPNDASLMILDLNFPFSDFLNASSKMYADDIKISSLYLYDWNDKNKDGKPDYTELSMVNRGGSWGTVQQLQVSDPNLKIKHIPLVGVYPVPTRFSYWQGDTKKNSTSMDYTITASYYKKQNWSDIWVNSDDIQVAPYSSTQVVATLIVPSDSMPGVHQGFLSFKDSLHEVNVPVSFGVLKKLQPKDLPTVIQGTQNGDVLYGNGYIGGAFDMANRYNAGDWRQYYFDVQDRTINAASLNISWENKDTNLSVFVVDPQGRIVQTNVPAGILGQFQGWPTGDWLGTSSPFSEGGGFYPIKNKDATSTILYAPINQTGTYSILMHSTLFGGQSVAEPLTVTAKFSTILPDENGPKIQFGIPDFINSTFKIKPKIIGEDIDSIRYYLDGIGPQKFNETIFSIISQQLTEGTHTIRLVVTDTVGHTISKEALFTIDNTAPEIIFKSLTNGSTISNISTIDLQINEQNLLDHGGITVILPHQKILDKSSVPFDTRTLENGKYDITVLAIDKAGNEASQTIVVNIDNNAISKMFSPERKESSNEIYYTLTEIIIGIAAAIVIIIITFKKFKISKRS